MDEFAHFINKKLSINGSEYSMKESDMKALTDKYFIYFAEKAIKCENYFIYSKQQYICAYDFNIHFPIFNSQTESFMTNIDFSLFNTKHDDIIIIPLLVFNNKNTIHITTLYINKMKKYLLYFDSYGYTRNDLIKHSSINILLSSIKNDLKLNDLINNDYTTTILDNPWQNYIKDEKNPWYYYYSCIVLQILFMIFYFSIADKNKADIVSLIEDLDKAIQEDVDKFRKIVVNSYQKLIRIN